MDSAAFLVDTFESIVDLVVHGSDGSNHSSAAVDESLWSLSRCIVRGSKPYKLL